MRPRRRTDWMTLVLCLLGCVLFLGSSAGDRAPVQFRFARSYSPFLVALLCAAVAVGGWWSLRREAAFLSKTNYYLLISLRVLPFVVLIFLLLKPVLAWREESESRQHVLLLLDESESMTIADKVLSRVQLATAAHLLDLRTRRSSWPPEPDAAALPTPERERANQTDLGLTDRAVDTIKETSRAALVRRALLRDDGELLEGLRDDYLLTVYGFSNQTREIPFGQTVKPSSVIEDIATTGASTRLGTVLQRLVQEYRGRPMAGIVLVSDGRNVGGIPPGGAAEIAGDARIPIYTVPVGAGGSRDIAVTALIAESVVFKDDEFPISAKISSRGYQGFSVPVVLECDGADVDTKAISLTGKEQLVTFRYKREAEGTIRVRVKTRAQEAEETDENNSADTEIRVIDKKINVLMVEEIPRWDYRYLRNTLIRDAHVDVKVFLQQADQNVQQSDPLYLSSFPVTEKQLFEYDLLILGSLRPRFLREDQLRLIETFVSKMGGGLIVMAAENVSPALYSGTPVEALLPVRLTRDARPWLDPDRLELRTVSRRLQLTDEGRRHTLAALDPEADRNERVWKDFPVHYWAAPVGGLKPAAQSLVESVGVRDGSVIPAVVTQPYGLGRVLYIGIDSTWRWRFKVGDRHFVRFWSQAVQHLTLSRLMGQNKRLQIVADKESYEAGETVSLSVRVLDASFQPRTEDEITLAITDQTGKRHEVRGTVEPDREGVYSAIFKIPYEGRYVVQLEDAGEKAELAFEAKRARLELREPEADWPGMSRIAERSGGSVVPLDHLDRLPSLLGRNRTRFVDQREQALWDWWPFLVFFVFVKTVELSLRKYWHLK